jgi:hypothetical protein
MQPSGFPAAKMNARQFDPLRALVELYAYNLPDDLAEHSSWCPSGSVDVVARASQKLETRN